MQKTGFWYFNCSACCNTRKCGHSKSIWYDKLKPFSFNVSKTNLISIYYFNLASGKIVDSSQEMITLGMCNIFGSFVQSMPTSGAFTRSAVSNASGVRTPLSGIFSGKISKHTIMLFFYHFKSIISIIQWMQPLSNCFY